MHKKGSVSRVGPLEEGEKGERGGKGEEKKHN